MGMMRFRSYVVIRLRSWVAKGVLWQNYPHSRVFHRFEEPLKDKRCGQTLNLSKISLSGLLFIIRLSRCYESYLIEGFQEQIPRIWKSLLYRLLEVHSMGLYPSILQIWATLE